jgi:hypothetical protein
MYGRLQVVRDLSRMPDQASPPPQLLEVIAGHPGFAGTSVMEQVGVGWGTMLTLWRSREDAEQAAERTAAALGPRPFPLHADDIYEVDDDWPGRSATEQPRAASIVYFDGPLSPAHVAAARRANRERLQPALRDLPGHVQMLTLWDPEHRKAVGICLATSVEALEAGGKAIGSTELLPGEEPALLTGPDRVEIHRVLHHSTTSKALETAS